MKSKNYIRAIVYVTVLVWTAVLILIGQVPSVSWFKPLAAVTSVVLIVVMIFDLWLWKWRFFHGWFVKRPVIDGTWKAELRSNWINPETGQAGDPIEAYIAIEQTLSSLGLRLFTAESTSELIGAEIVCSADGVYCIGGVYRNEPQFHAREDSPIHYGPIWLTVIEEADKKIVGHYWTDRSTAGEMELTRRTAERFQSFESSQHFFRK